MKSILFFIAAALFEIAGCFSFWTWLRGGGSWWLILPGILSLSLFALCLTQIETAHAGRAYAAYGGIYIASSLLWLRGVKGVSPDRWEILGSVICTLGASVILLGPRP